MALRAWTLLWAVLVLSGCAATGYRDLDRLRANSNWSVRTFTDSSTPSLAAYRAAPEGSDGTLWIYIEGDGRAWITPRQMSDDPTPDQPVSLNLATIPQDNAVLYLARPCQYLAAREGACDSSLWSLARYSEAVVGHLNHVVDQYVSLATPRRLIFVGYSGGGALAMLMASRRTDVAGVITLAANLDVAAWTAHHKITPLSRSLDPARDPNSAKVSQVHVVGLKDGIVPPAIVRSFVGKMPALARITVIEEPQFTHTCCWTEHWPRLRSNAMSKLGGF